MKHIRAWTHRLFGSFGRRRGDRDFADEIESHLRMHIDDNIRSGLSPEEARRNALIKLGGLDAVKEDHRDRRGIPLIETFIRDARFGLRILLRSPGFTAVAVLTLGLGIGANTAIFGVVNAVLLRPLPYPDSSRLVMVWGTHERTGRREDVASYPDFQDWKSQANCFNDLAAVTTRSATLSLGDDAELVPMAIQVTPGFLEMLGVSPALGRAFGADEGEVGAPKVALIGDNYWKTRFGGSRDILGSKIIINEETYSIIGVLPPGFTFADGAPQVCTPLIPDTNRGHGFLNVVGRLRPKVSVSQAQAEMDAITQRLAAQYPKTDKGVGANVQSLVDATVGKSRAALWILLGVVAAVLLIACANVANLMLSRSAGRKREIAVRAALGASRARLAQQLLIESSILALAGGAFGLLLSSSTSRFLVAILSKNFQIPRIENTRTDSWVLLFTVALSLVTGLIFGAVPALSASSTNLNTTLNAAGRATTEGPRGRRVRGALVVAEIALALVLLAGAGHLLRSFLAIRSTAPGFQAEGLVIVNFRLPGLKFATLPVRRQYFANVLSSIRSAPGVSSAALVADLPLGGGSDSMGFHIAGRPDPSPGTAFSANFNISSAGYFRTMGIPLLAGREFIDQDGPDTPGVITINQTAARTLWPEETPIGKQILLPGPNNTNTLLTIAGVAGDVRQSDLGREPKPEIFLNYAQASQSWSWLTLVVRTEHDPAEMITGLKSLVQSVDRSVPVTGAQTMDRLLSGTLAPPRTYTLLLSIFALLGLILAVVGIYGVVSYTVAQRTHEIGIRMALGAKRRDILKITLRNGLGLACGGVLIGLCAAVASTRVLTYLIANVKTGDWLTLVLMSALLLVVAAAATFVPASRASRVDPNLALRCD